MALQRLLAVIVAAGLLPAAAAAAEHDQDRLSDAAVRSRVGLRRADHQGCGNGRAGNQRKWRRPRPQAGTADA